MKGGTLFVLLLATFAVAVFSDHHEYAAQLPAAATVTAHSAAEGDDKHDQEDFDKIDDRLDKLASRLVQLNEKIHDRIDPERIKRAHSLEARVRKLEGTGCDKRHFQCGGNDPECVSYGFVCDGHKDCRNGADEESCVLPIKAGDEFEGHMLWDKCTKRHPDEMGFEITAVQTSTYYTVASRVQANIVMDHEGDYLEAHTALPTFGYYRHGTHTLVLAPPEADRLAFACEFDGFNWDRCKGRIMHESSLEVCAEAIFIRKHGDDEDHHGH
jgi:hypothetical protein